jgi:hypothetical protein
MSEENTTTIPTEEYLRLLEVRDFMDCLVGCGVDNWCGYDDAREMMEEDK